MSANQPSVAPDRNGRLACACNCAYGISQITGEYHPPPIYDPGVGWIGTPKAFAAATEPGEKLINACLVGTNSDGIIVAFRGTIPPAWTPGSLEDWWQDIVDSAPEARSPLPGKVHTGFWDALHSIWGGVLGEIRALHTANPHAAIYVTGHSKGGPLASIGAALLHLADGITAREVVTFASPHPGDQAFVDGYPSALPVTRYENYLDIVPFVPPTDAFYQFFSGISDTWVGKEFCKIFPFICKAIENASTWDYASLGALSFVTSSGEVVGADDYRADVDYRLIQIFGTLFGLLGDDEAVSVEALVQQAPRSFSHTGLATIGAAHCIACKQDTPAKYCAGGYMTGSGASVICPTNHS